MRDKRTVIAVIACLFLSVGCKKKSGGGTTTPPPSTTLPSIDGPTNPIPLIPITDVYERAGARIEIHDGFQDQGYRFSPAEKSSIWNVLDNLPASHISTLKYIGTYPISDQERGLRLAVAPANTVAFFVLKTGNTLFKTAELTDVTLHTRMSASSDRFLPQYETVAGDVGIEFFASNLVHEIGHNVQNSLISGTEDQEWTALNAASTTNADYDPFAISGGAPYGSTNRREDFATIYSSLGNRPVAALVTSLRTLQQTGASLHFLKNLYMMSLFADPASGTINLTSFDPGAAQIYSLPATYSTANPGFIMRIDCAGKPAACVPFEMQMALSSSGQILLIQYRDYFANRNNPPLVTLNAQGSIRAPQTFLNRLGLPGAQAQTISDTSPEAAQQSPEPAAPLVQSTTPADFQALADELGSTQVISPNAPTFYVPVTTIMPADGSRPVIKPTMEEMLRPHGAFQVSPKNNQ